jgi:hypothetical protein
LVASSELAHLNFVYSLNIGDINKKNTFEEKILSYTQSYSHSFKNILQFLSTKKKEYLYEQNSIRYFHHIYFNIIFNLLRRGLYSLAIYFIKIIIKLIFQEIENGSQENSEIILLFIIEIAEYDVEFALSSAYKIYKKFISKYSNLNENFPILFKILNIKCISLSCNPHVLVKIDILRSQFSKIEENVFYYTLLKYYELLNHVTSEISEMNLLQKISDFRKFCKEMKIIKYKLLSDLLLCRLLVKEERMTEASIICNKIIKKNELINDNILIVIKAKLILSQIYSNYKNIESLKFLMNELKSCVDKYGLMEDKFEFYFIQTQIDVLENCFSYKNIQICLQNAILLNHKEKINYSFLLYKFISSKLNIINTENIVKVEKDIQNHLLNIDKLNTINKKFALNYIQELELLNSIHNNNLKLINYINQFN